LYTFLPAFWKFENAPAVELRSSHPKTLTHCFLYCLRCLITLPTQLMLHKSEKIVVGGCQIRAIGGVWKNFPPHLCIDVTKHSRIAQQLVPSTTVLSFVCCSQFACKNVAHDFRYDPRINQNTFYKSGHIS